MLEVHKCVGRPQRRAHFLAGDQLARAVQQHLQDLKRLPGQAQTNALFSEFLRREVRFKWAEGNERHGLSASRHPALPPRTLTRMPHEVSDCRYISEARSIQPACFVRLDVRQKCELFVRLRVLR